MKVKQQILFATKNKGKFKEVSQIFRESEFELLSPNDFNNVGEIIEDGNTFEENTVKKALYVFNQYKIPVVADDSGLVVEQLNGAPGIYSARYAGDNANDDENNKKLIEQLMSFTRPHIAKFVCSAVYYDGSKIIKSSGEVVGQIIHELRGTNGFGYDPLFIPKGYEKTSAELSLSEKNEISHRAKAFKLLLKLIQGRQSNE